MVRDKVVAAVVGAPRAMAATGAAARRVDVAAAEEAEAVPVVPAVAATAAVADLPLLAMQQEGPHQRGVNHEGE